MDISTLGHLRQTLISAVFISLEALFEVHRKKPNSKSRAKEATEVTVIAYAMIWLLLSSIWLTEKSKRLIQAISVPKTTATSLP